MRVVVGFTAMAGATTWLVASESSILTLGAGVLIVTCGTAVTVGFLTPQSAAGLVAAGVAALGFRVVPSGSGLSTLSVAVLTTNAAALFLLGPGAFSVDARLFGRREIAIPHDPSVPPGTQSGETTCDCR